MPPKRRSAWPPGTCSARSCCGSAEVLRTGQESPAALLPDITPLDAGKKRVYGLPLLCKSDFKLFVSRDRTAAVYPVFACAVGALTLMTVARRGLIGLAVWCTGAFSRLIPRRSDLLPSSSISLEQSKMLTSPVRSNSNRLGPA